MENSWSVENTNVSLYFVDGKERLKIGDVEYNLTDFKKLEDKNEKILYSPSYTYEIPIGNKIYYIHLEDNKYYLLYNGKDVKTNQAINKIVEKPKWRFLVYTLQIICYSVAIGFIKFYIERLTNTRIRTSSGMAVLMVFSAAAILRKTDLNISQKLVRVFFVTLGFILLTIVLIFVRVL